MIQHFQNYIIIILNVIIINLNMDVLSFDKNKSIIQQILYDLQTKWQYFIT